MAHMEKQEFSGLYYEVETREGTTFVPSDVCGSVPGMEVDTMYCKPDEHDDIWDNAVSTLSDYVGNGIENITPREGTLYRLSAPGYMDCTDWTTDENSPLFDDMEEE